MIDQRVVAAVTVAACVVLIVVLAVTNAPKPAQATLVMYDSGTLNCDMDACHGPEFALLGCKFAFCDDGDGGALGKLVGVTRVIGPNGVVIANTIKDLVNGTMDHTLTEADVTSKPCTAFGPLWINQCRDDTALSFYEMHVPCVGNATVVCFCMI